MKTKTYHSQSISRRRFIKLGSSVIVIPLLGFNTTACRYLIPPVIDNWDELSEAGDSQGELVIERVEGQVQSEGAVLNPGDRIPSGQMVVLKSGYVFASLPDQSMIKLSNKAELTVDLDSQKGGVLNLKRGGLLAAVRKSTVKPYLVRNASAMIGVRGTVLFTQVLMPEDKEDRRIPESATDYFCICNGKIDFLTQSMSRVRSDRAVYHNAYFLKPDGEAFELNRAGFLLNHSDDEIKEVIMGMKGPKLPTRWMNRDKEMYSSY